MRDHGCKVAHGLNVMGDNVYFGMTHGNSIMTSSSFVSDKCVRLKSYCKIIEVVYILLLSFHRRYSD